ncbi:unnamed protein product, partial [Prorocentrum cordatum]
GGGGGGGEGGGGGGGADGGGGGGGGAAGGGEGGAPRAPSRSCAVSPRGVLSGEGRRAPPWGAPGAPPRGRAAWSGVAREDPGRPGSLAPRKKKNSRRKVCRNVSGPAAAAGAPAPPAPRQQKVAFWGGGSEGGRGPRAAPGGPRRASPLLWPGSSATVAGGDRPRPRGRRALVSGAVGPNSRKTACRKPRGTASRMDQLCERIERGRHSELWENARGTRACKWFGHGPRLPTRGFAASPLANTPWARLRYR